MRISLVTTVKNEAHSLEELIGAVRAQTRNPDEWIVADGGSEDDTVARLRLEPTCTLLIEPGNIARGRNAAIAHATGDIIAVTDGGCRPDAQWLARLIAPLEAGRGNITAGRTCPRVDRPFDAVQWTLLDQFVAACIPWRRAALSSRSLAFNRCVWAQCPYPEWLNIGEDTWVIEEWQRRGWSIVAVDDAWVKWKMRPSPWTFVTQHFRYMQGDGRARMHTVRHLLRFCFYAGIAGLLGLGLHRPAAAWLAAGGWLSYLGATAVRLPDALRGQSRGFRLRALCVLPWALLVMDVAKICGYALGTVDRLFKPVSRGSECPNWR